MTDENMETEKNVENEEKSKNVESEVEVKTEENVNNTQINNVVFVGKKGVMGYVLAVVTQFNNGAQKVTIKARGKLISRAVDVAEIVRNRFMPSVKNVDILIKTEELASEDGSMSKVSAIEIELGK